MSYNLIDFFNAFHSLKGQLKLSASSQAVYFSLLGEFNAARFPERISLSSRELKDLAGLKSVATAHECKNVLKNKNLIDFKTKGSVTWYELLTEHLSNGNRTPAKQVPNASRTEADYSSRSNSLPSPTEGDERRKTSDDDAHARETGKVAAATGKDADAGAQAKPLSSPTFDANDIQAEWVKAFGYDLRGNYALELEQLASKDYARAQAAIARTLAQKEKQGINDEYHYFRAVYDGLKPTAEPVKEKPKKDDLAEQLRLCKAALKNYQK